MLHGVIIVIALLSLCLEKQTLGIHLGGGRGVAGWLGDQISVKCSGLKGKLDVSVAIISYTCGHI